METREEIEREIRKLKEELRELNLQLKPLLEKLRSEKLSGKERDALDDEINDVMQEQQDILTDIACLEDQLDSDDED